MQNIITHAITDLKSCKAVLKIILAKNPNVGMIIVSEQAEKQIADEIEKIAYIHGLSVSSQLRICGVRITTKAKQEAFEQAMKLKQEQIMAIKRMQEMERKYEEEQRQQAAWQEIMESKVQWHKLERWQAYKRKWANLKGKPKSFTGE